MNNYIQFFSGLAVMAGVTYLVRMLPLVLVKKKIENRFINSLVQRSIGLKKEALKLVKSFSKKQRNTELRSF